jgi:NADPH-dependent curcumin reductase
VDDRKSYAKPVGLGEVMSGESVCEVIASDQAGYDVGDIVLAQTGWRTHAASAGATLRKLDPAVAPITTGLGVLGMPGFTAYAGLNLIGKPKPGETVVVAAATGPVGSLVGQLAKLTGARAVGIAGGLEKCRSVVEEFRFDAAVDHRLPDFAENLATACPATMREVLSKSLTLRGYINYEFAADHYAAFLRTVGTAVTDGRVRYHEDVTDGLENAPAAFIGMLEGRNFGKALVRVTPSA